MSKSNGKAYLTLEQVDRLAVIEKELAQYTFNPKNVGWLNAQQADLCKAVYKEVTGVDAVCKSCNSDWLCRLNVWYIASKEKFANIELMRNKIAEAQGVTPKQISDYDNVLVVIDTTPEELRELDMPELANKLEKAQTKPKRVMSEEHKQKISESKRKKK